MKLRNAVVVSILAVLGIACVGAAIALYTGFPVKASVPDSAAGLGRIPSGYQFVYGANLQRLTQSPSFSKFQQSRPFGDEMSSFIEKTGLDPMRDITSIVGGGKAGQKGVIIVSGVFRIDAISSYLRSRAASEEQSYGGVPLMRIPDPKSTEQGWIAFIHNQELALGDLDSLKEVIDIRGDERRSILYSETMGPLIRTAGLDEMFWFAGDASALIARAQTARPLASPLMANSSSIKAIAGSMNLDDAITGTIRATAFTPEQALKLVEGMRGLIALGQITGSKNPELTELLAGFAISQNSEVVRLDINLSADLLSRMNRRPALQR